LARDWLNWLLVFWIIAIHCRRKFRSQLPTVWTDEKQRWEESEKRREEKRRRKKIKKRKSEKKEVSGARKGRRKSRNTVFFH